MSFKILAVEDDPDINKTLKIRLQAAGYTVIQAEDGLQGLLSCLRHRPDLLLLDISLPAGDGFSIIERMREHHPETKDIPFVIFTASRRPELKARALELGAAAFIEKPFDSKELLRAIHDALQPTTA